MSFIDKPTNFSLSILFNFNIVESVTFFGVLITTFFIIPVSVTTTATTSVSVTFINCNDLIKLFSLTV